MNHRNPSILERATAAILRWADDQCRLAEDEQYWHAAQHDPRLMADITCAIARSEAESTGVAAGKRPARARPTLSTLITAHQVASH